MARQFLKQYFEEMPCYISVQDKDLRIMETNRRFKEDFGEGIGEYCYKVYKHREEKCPFCPVVRTFENGQSITQEEVVTSLRDEQMNVLVTTAPIRDADGLIISVMEMSTDITQVRELQSQLTSLGLLIGSISHGLKGLLNGLAGGMYLVDTGFKKDDRSRIEKGLETVNRNVARIQSMVSDILYYAKEREFDIQPVDAAELLREVCRTGNVQSRARELGVTLDVRIDESAGQLDGDKKALHSALDNLVDNSLDACRVDRKKEAYSVMVSAKGDADHVYFEISDNGIGMDQETREKAFSLFFSSKGAEGTGLGLFIANKIVAKHHGEITIDSMLEKGTRFTVKIPRRWPLPAEKT